MPKISLDNDLLYQWQEVKEGSFGLFVSEHDAYLLVNTKEKWFVMVGDPLKDDIPSQQIELKYTGKDSEKAKEEALDRITTDWGKHINRCTEIYSSLRKMQRQQVYTQPGFIQPEISITHKGHPHIVQTDGPVKSRRICMGCGSEFSWEGFDDRLEEWMKVHSQHKGK